MDKPPKWYTPVTLIALLWNLIGCVAFVFDMRVTPEQVAHMKAAQQAMYYARTAWWIAAYAAAVFGGAIGSLGLLLRKRWALPFLLLSLIGLIVQDYGMIVAADAVAHGGPGVLVLQGIVLLVGIALVLLARKAAAKGWIARRT